jgi:hypothetical protein
VCTLERHFNSIDSNSHKKDTGLDSLKEPITNLINHLKLIWMNTKHFHKDLARFKNLMDSVEREINFKVRKVVSKKLRDINETKFELSDLMKEVKSGMEVAQTFEDVYTSTKRDVKEENSEYSWDESQELFKETRTTQSRLKEL